MAIDFSCANCRVLIAACYLCYNRTVFKSAVITSFFLGVAFAQQEPKPQQQPSGQQGQPQVKLNYLYVCAPTQEEQGVIKTALATVPGKPAFIPDFEISRGLATLKDAPTSKFVRLRREFSPESPFLTAQYSMSTDSTSTVETLVLRMRDPKDFHELSLQDRSSSAAASPSAMLAVDTPVNRIRVERLAKSSVVLARCENADQSGFEPMFRQASDIMAQYRQALGLRAAFRSDIAWLGGGNATKPGNAPAKKRK